MNILLVNSFYYPDIIGGTEVSTQKLAEGLYKSGHKVSVLCTGLKDKYEIINNIDVYRIKINNLYQPIQAKWQNPFIKVLYRFLDVYNIFNKNKLKKSIYKIKPDIVHVNNIYGISPYIWTVAKKYNIPVVHTLRDYYLMCPRANLIKKNGNSCRGEILFVCKLYRLFFKKLSQNVSYVTAPSKFTLHRFLNAGYFKEVPSKAVYNAIDFDISEVKRVYAAKKENLNKINKIRYVYLGGLEIHKGIKQLLDVFRLLQHKDMELHIAGRGTLEDYIKECAALDERIKYHGFLEEKQKEKLLTECDVLIVPSIWEEPFGRVVIDAYKCGLPVIGSKRGGITEIIDDKITGLLFDPDKTNELSDAILYFSDKNNIMKMLDNCMNKLMTFSINEQVKSFEDIYHSLLK